MAITIKIDDDEATVHDGKWTSDNRALAEGLNGLPDNPYALIYAPSDDWRRAMLAAQLFGGTILTKMESVEGRIY